MSEKLDPISDIHERIESEEKFPEDIKQEFKQFVSENYYDIDYGASSVLIDEFTVKNFNNLTRANIGFEEEDYVIYGENSLGKTSILRAIQYNLMGLPENKQKYGMTGLIQSGKDRAFTEGRWSVDEEITVVQRELYREGRGGELHGHDTPIVVEDAGEADIPEDRHDRPETVYNAVGISPLCNRGYDPYEFMSLFFLMSRDFLNFINWKGKSTEVIDILFGIYLTNVSNAIDNRAKKVGKIPDYIDESVMKKEQYQSELSNKKHRLEDLRDEESMIKDKIADKLENLNSLDYDEDSEERLNRLRSHLTSLKSKRADLKGDRAEAVSDLAEVRRLIERYKDQELIGDLDDVASELRDLMSVPDRCPVCMNEVDEAQRRNLRDEHDCPLCEKDMPEDRIRKEKEYQAPDSIGERRKHQQEEIDELREREANLESKLEALESRISTTEENIEEVDQRLEDNNLEQEVQRREELETEIRRLRREAVNLDIEIESLEKETDILQKEIKAQEHLQEIRSSRKDMNSYLKRLSGLVDMERKNQRKKLQRQLSGRMQRIVEKLTEGAFSNATAVSFDSPDNYHFTVHTPSRKYRTSQADKESAEATLYSLIFHSSVLKHLSEVAESSIPIRFFVVDSPFSNDMDPGNFEDVISLISGLPEYLDKYQILVTMAKPEDEVMEELKDGGHNLLDFSQVS